ncbi:MAG: hypothetical protein AAB383_04405 [Patescibacteria group bacterium]
MPNCKNCQSNFSLEEADFEFLKKFDVPAPTFCPDCRNQRRLVFRNDRNFYRRECGMCKKVIIAIFSEDKPFPVYCKDCYLSDAFDPLQYGVDFDPSRPFIEQFAEMRARVPRVASFQTQSENSDYTVHSGKNKNCYMGSSYMECENSYYSHWLFYAKDCLDLYLCQKMERCYFCTSCDDCYGSAYLENCQGVSFSYLSFDCRNSSQLIGCVGLRQKTHQILNQSASEEELASTLKKLNTDPAFRAEFQRKYDELRLQVPVPEMWVKNSENVSGNYITNCRNAQHSYNVRELEDARHVYEVGHLKDGMDVTHCANGEFIYEVKAVIDLSFSKFCNLCYQSSQLEYCDNCQSTKNCFGSMGLKGHSYCILNKQYSKEAYESLRAQIIEKMRATGEYGEFFPAALSPFGYNETKAMDHYELTREEALAKGFKWKDEDPRSYQPQTAVLADDIAAVPDSITNEILACSECRKNFKIIPQELKLYRELGVPVPKKCFGCRHKERKSLQNPRKLWNRECAQCKAAIVTTYGPEKKERVFCEKCYLAAIY